MKIDKEKFTKELVKRCMGRSDFIKAGIPSMTYQNVKAGREVRTETMGKIIKRE